VKLCKLSENGQKPWTQTTPGSDYAEQLEMRFASAPDPSLVRRASAVCILTNVTMTTN